MKTILSTRMMAGLAFYSFLPFFSLYLIKSKQFNQIQAAFLAMILVFSSRAFTLIGAIPIEKLGIKNTIILSYLLSGIAIFNLLLLNNFYFIIIITLLIGAGFSIGSIAIKSFVSKNNTSNMIRIFSYLNIVINLSSAAGTIIGEYISKNIMLFFPLASSSSLILLAIYVKFCLIDEKKINKSISLKIQTQQNAHFLYWIGFLIASSVPWIVYGLFFNALAYQIAQSDSQTPASLFFSINAILIIIFQFFISKIMELMSLSKLRILNFCIHIFLIFLLLIYNPNNIIFLLIFVVFFTVCEMFWSPVNDYLSCELNPFLYKSRSISLCNFFWGICESIGTFIGVNYNISEFKNISIIVIALLLLTLFGNAITFSNKKFNFKSKGIG